MKSGTPLPPGKVKSEPPKPLELLTNTAHKVVDIKEGKEKAVQPVSLSPQDGATAPEDVTISPEVMHKFGLRYNVADWPPPRRED